MSSRWLSSILALGFCQGACSSDEPPPSTPVGEAGEAGATGATGATGEAGSAARGGASSVPGTGEAGQVGKAGEASGGAPMDTEPSGDAGSGGEPDVPWPSAPSLTNPVTLEGRALGEAALRVLGSSCSECHSIDRPTLSKWRALSDRAVEECLSKATLADRASVDALVGCISEDPKNPKSGFKAEALGIYSAATHLPWFSFVFEHRTQAGADWLDAWAEFERGAGMPRSGKRLSQADFDIVAAWFTQGLPEFLDLVPEDLGAGECTPYVSPELSAHIEAMATAGWRSKNKSAGVLMYGCKPGAQGRDCLQEKPLASASKFAKGWSSSANFQLRLLYDNSSAKSKFWSRSSADGRYFGSGVSSGNGAQIIDLQRDKVIPVDASYDPGFFADNSGFVFHGVPTDGETETGLVCEQTLLASGPKVVTGKEPECAKFDANVIGLYEQVGRSVSGGDYWAASGIFETDEPGFSVDDPNFIPRGPLAASFDEKSAVRLTPLVNQGNRFEVGVPTSIATPHEGDPVLSPSGLLLINRVKGKELAIPGPRGWGDFFTSQQSGYTVHRISAARGAEGLTASLKSVGRYCLSGGKPSVSLDERWMVLHHYVSDDDARELGFAGPDDPKFANYRKRGASNLYVVDLRTAVVRRLTNMAPGEHALYPHFRSDGWIYFVVRAGEDKEYFVASDAALALEAR